MKAVTALALITLRPGPADEPCARVGDSGYAEIAFSECGRYIALLRRSLGLEPDGARLRIRRADSDYDPYIDVVVEYDDRNAVARRYAVRCEREAPSRWREDRSARAAEALTELN
jgi:hypothetical protein